MVYRVALPDEIGFAVNKDGVIKLFDARTKEILTRYQREKIFEKAPWMRAPFNQLTERVEAAKLDRKERWRKGEPWFPLNIEEIMKGLDDELSGKAAKETSEPTQNGTGSASSGAVLATLKAKAQINLPIPTATLKSREGVKWPRYEIQLAGGLSYREAQEMTYKVMRSKLQFTERQVVLLSQFSYSPSSGKVSTRVRSGSDSGN